VGERGESFAEGAVEGLVGEVDGLGTDGGLPSDGNLRTRMRTRTASGAYAAYRGLGQPHRETKDCPS
jgi:hypothetical protein